MPTKSLFLSKVFWLNAITAVVTIGGSLTEMLPDQYDKYILGVVSVANILLRLITNSPASVSGK